MSHYKPYPAYRDSGVEWIGQVPEHWDVKRLGFFFEERREKVSDIDFPALSVTMGGVVPQIEGVAKTEDNDNRKKVCSGDFVINSRSDRKGSSGLSNLDGSVSLINTVLSPSKNVFGRFVHHLLRSTAFQEEYYRYGNGLVADLWTTHYSDMRNIGLGIPPMSEQSAIAYALDRETSRIDALIAKKTRFIELLKEKRQALITHAVTKGLDPDVKMKDSGVEWIGEVPEHWEAAPFKRWFSTVSGGTPDTSKQDLYYAATGGVPWIRTTDLTNGPITSHEISITERAIQDTACRPIPPESVLVAMYGGEGTIGKNGLLKFPCCINQAVCALLPSNAFDPDFTFYYVTFYRPHWMVDAASTRKDPNISQDLVRSASVTHPPLEEQREIVRYIKKNCDHIDLLTEKTQRSIDLLKERRAAFITAAVTGQVDLRESA